MAQYSKRHPQGSEKSAEESLKLATANQRPGQTKEQTKIIAQGIQKGIEQYKKQQKGKSRELDKQLKSVTRTKEDLKRTSDEGSSDTEIVVRKQHWLPWSLLLASWLVIAAFYFL